MNTGKKSPKLAIERVHKSFGSTAVLNGVSLDVSSTEVIAFVGSSGSGKSTLLRCVNLLESIDAGSICLDGIDISTPGFKPDPVRRRVGMVFQSFNLFPHMSVVDNVSIGPRRVLGRASSDARSAALELLDRLGLAERAHSFPDQLSGGQQQRVAIARCLAMSPEVMLLDEITSALDPELVGEVLDVVREMKDSGMTMLLATHEMGFAREIADRVCFLHNGQVLECSPPEEFFTDPRHERTRHFLKRVTDSGRM
ncbi:MAG: amino acid ABC transporter ATP-binding protein [Actinomycetota bacterium]